MTHTFVTFEVSAPLYNEVANKMKAAGYDHAFVKSYVGSSLVVGANNLHGEGEVLIDMHGIAIKKRPKPSIIKGQPADFEAAQLIVEAFYKSRYGMEPEVIPKNARLSSDREIVRWLMARIKDGSLPT